MGSKSPWAQGSLPDTVMRTTPGARTPELISRYVGDSGWVERRDAVRPDVLTHPTPVTSNSVGYMYTTEWTMPERLTHDSDVSTSSNYPIMRCRYR
jgi:hypothetical protein